MHLARAYSPYVYTVKLTVLHSRFVDWPEFRAGCSSFTVPYVGVTETITPSYCAGGGAGAADVFEFEFAVQFSKARHSIGGACALQRSGRAID